MYDEQVRIKENRKSKYKIARELKFDVETSKRVRDFRTRNFIKFCYYKINNKEW